jgi:phage antirepressor YoqD-like protein
MDTPTKGGKQAKNYIPEGDLYRLIVRSKLPSAVRFEELVFDEILPSIRKTGGYITDELLKKLDAKEIEINEFVEILKNERRALKEERNSRNALQRYVTKVKPKVRYHDVILQCEDAIPITVIAKDYGFTAAAFNRLLHNIGVQYKVGDTWILYKEHCYKGYTASRTCLISEKKSTMRTYWTQKGRKMIYELLKEYGLWPEIESRCKQC